MTLIAVTSANGRIGKRLLPCLKEGGYQTVALVRSPQTLAGADTTIADWMNAPGALDALHNADVVIHLTGDWSARNREGYHAANVAPTERVAAAMKGGKARRVIYLSYVGADVHSDNWFLSAKGQSENLLIGTGKQAVIFRCPAIINTPDAPTDVEQGFIAQDGKAVMMIGSGRQRWRPVLQGDVVAAIMAAIEGGQAGIYDLTGLEEMTADEVIRVINRGQAVTIRHIPGGVSRLMSRFMPDLPPTTVDTLLRDMTGNPEPLQRAFNLRLNSMREAWR